MRLAPLLLIAAMVASNIWLSIVDWHLGILFAIPAVIVSAELMTELWP